jgi:hypothetical protein
VKKYALSFSLPRLVKTNKQADRAFYEAKRQGRNRCFVHADSGEPLKWTFYAGVV